jgi:hypothetical protein
LRIADIALEPNRGCADKFADAWGIINALLLDIPVAGVYNRLSSAGDCTSLLGNIVCKDILCFSYSDV